MRPPILDALFTASRALPGIGPQLAKLLERVAGPLIVDLLWTLPVGVVDRRAAPPLNALKPDCIVTLQLRVDAHEPGVGKRPYRIRCSNATGFISLAYFHVRGDRLEKLLPIGSERIVSGRVDFYGEIPQIVHPDHVVPPEEADRLDPIEPVYPLTSGLPPRIMRKAAIAALLRMPALPEWNDTAFMVRRAWPPWNEAVALVHAPQSATDLDPGHPARERLAYDEILASQLAVALVRARQRRRPGRVLIGTGTLRDKVEAGLGFSLTATQRMALAEIAGDMREPRRMMRLLHGDVGSGKTVVALLAMLSAVEEGAQAALMAPTEILARQHYATLQRFGAPARVDIGLLTGREKGKSRGSVLAGLRSGALPIVIGTHALFQADVVYRDLALIVIDEQHRFGVEQRLELSEKGRNCDTLLMSATPIPRTLMMTAYGDLDASRLTEKPAGRQKIDTRMMALDRIEEIVAALGRAMRAGAKAYWICPLVAESEISDLAAAEARHTALDSWFPGRVGLVHGRMKGADKDRAMARFAGPETDLLVATTVIEVGIDVPDATIIVIEHAERFGLAQLHQLRGRVGRGDKPSTCLLLYGLPLTELGEKRLRALRDTDDGFRIAEEDLRLRGAGEVLGTRQSGLPELRLADLAAHEELVAIANDDARYILNTDAALGTERGQALRTLLYLFRRDEAIQFLRAG